MPTPNTTNAVNEDYFSRMPAELRIEVLRWTLRLTPLILTQWMNMPMALHLTHSKQICPVPSEGLPQWLLTSRAFFTEGLQELHLLFHATVGPCAARVREETPTMYQAIDPCAMTSLTIATGALCTSDELGQNRYGAGFSFSNAGRKTIARVLKYTLNHGNAAECKIRTLRVKTAFTNVCTYCQSCRIPLGLPEAWEVDMRQLLRCRLALDNFELEVMDVDTKVAQDGTVHGSNCWDRAEWAFVQEVRWIAGRLMGDPYGFCSTQLVAGSMRMDLVLRFKARGRQQGIQKESWRRIA